MVRVADPNRKGADVTVRVRRRIRQKLVRLSYKTERARRKRMVDAALTSGDIIEQAIPLWEKYYGQMYGLDTVV